MLTGVGGGFWQPDAATLAKLRRDIDRKPHKIKAVLRNAGIRKHFLRGAADDDKKVVKAFTNLPMNQSNALKRNPKVSDVCCTKAPCGNQLPRRTRKIMCHMSSSSRFGDGEALR